MLHLLQKGCDVPFAQPQCFHEGERTADMAWDHSGAAIYATALKD